jgi:hypothetical protein
VAERSVTTVECATVRGELRKFLVSIEAIPQLNFLRMPRPNVVFDYFRAGSRPACSSVFNRKPYGRPIKCKAARQVTLSSACCPRTIDGRVRGLADAHEGGTAMAWRELLNPG